MFLKRLELIGFKSFANKIGIDFVPGVTAVVGPNGSGKSNVTDAIRWVLGEQSAKSLRGSKMEDVIFAGSDTRKPLNFAEVTLILDNTDGLFPLDYTEVSVSRRVFRSGESAYLLNGQPCRLKDINDAFMDSGVGKEAFSIISQGRIDEILNSRPEDRRTIFDEAAGVLKYKNRKKKAEHKLFETEDNLDRVLDILKELDMRIGPLEKSANDAKLYNELTDEIRDADVQLLNFDAMHYADLIVSAEQQAKQLQQQKEQIQKEVRSSEKQMEIYKQASIEADTEAESQSEAYRVASAELEKWEGRRLLSLEQKKNTAQQLERLKSEYKQSELQREKIKEEIIPAAEAASEIEKEFEETEVELSSIAQLLSKSAAETEQEIDELKSIYIDLLNEEATQRNELKHINERLEGDKVSSEKMNEQTAAIHSKLRELEIEHKALAEKANAYKLQTAETNTLYESELQTVKVIEKQLTEKQQVLQKGLNRHHEMKGRLRALESMESDLTGFFSGVKEVLLAKRAQKLQGINGAVTELITVDSEYVKAIETALGGAAQHIVTVSELDARNAIAYLKSKNAGRATFLPRNVMKPRTIPAGVLSPALRHPEFISTADQLVQTADEFRVITGNLLGGTIVAKTLAGASAIAKMISYKYRVVTLDGDVVNAGGSLTGGGAKSQSSVFTRKAELENLKHQLSKMEDSIETAEKKVDAMKLEAYTHNQNAERCRQLLINLQKQTVESQTSLREIELSVQSLKKEEEAIVAGRADTQNSGLALIEKQEAVLANHERIKKELERIQREIQSLERLAANRRTEESSLLKKQSELREHAAVLRVQKKHQQTAIRNLRETLQHTEEKITMLHNEIQIFQGNEDGKEFTAEEIAKKMNELSHTKKQLEESLSDIRTRRLQSAEQLAATSEHLQKQRGQSAEVIESLHAINVSLSKLQAKYEVVAERLLEDYGLYPDGDNIEDFDVDLIRNKVEKLKSEAEQLGPINQSSIIEFHEVSERHRFLSEQRNDLVEAKNTLNDAMSEMDREMKNRFSSTFKAVQRRFGLVFKEMFGGGEADLLLTNPDNLLETGVDIVARPPGKKLQNLSLLSGGERALTAIVLLFSIIEVRPVPFCILDEVEAALDEANVVRYSKYLKKSSRNTQFIVITHRKGTMEGADVLYGITMQESGVSKLISVKLSEVPEEAIT